MNSNSGGTSGNEYPNPKRETTIVENYNEKVMIFDEKSEDPENTDRVD